MGICMLRASLAVLAALLLVAVLSVLIVESRAVNEAYYIAHADRMRAIETSKNDLTAIMQGAKSAFDDGRTVSALTELALSRLAENNTLLQSADERLRSNIAVNTQLSTYESQLGGFMKNGQEFTARQNAFASALRTLQDESPLIVKDLRRYNLRLESQNAFSLAIDVIEFATGGNGGDGGLLLERIEALRDDSVIQARSLGVLDSFIESATAVIEQRAAASAELLTINSSRVVENLWALSDAIQNHNRQTISRAERAGLLLSVCTVLLLFGVGYAMFRLQASYRELNKSNHDLESANNSLEERVTERTQELSMAYEDLKESQVQLVQAEKMSSLGELVAGISHEINTPLWYIISNSTVLQERWETVGEFCGVAEDMIDGVRSQENVKESIGRGLMEMQRILKDGFKEDIDEARDLLQDSIEGLEELTELAQSLKDFSRLDRARYGEFSVNDGLDKTLLIAKNRLKNKVEIHKHYGDVPTIHCSPSQINQIFLNLLTNAADAIEESGDIVIRTVKENDTVRVSFADTGSGISADALSKIRDPFFTTKDVGKGTGLGLSIVDQIITSHGGELQIESEVGKGTTVTVVLPVFAAPQEEDSGEAEAVQRDNNESAANDPDGEQFESADGDEQDHEAEVASV